MTEFAQLTRTGCKVTNRCFEVAAHWRTWRGQVVQRADHRVCLGHGPIHSMATSDQASRLGSNQNRVGRDPMPGGARPCSAVIVVSFQGRKMAPAVRPRHKFSGNSLRKVAKKALLMPGETGEAHGAVKVIDECLSGTASEIYLRSGGHDAQTARRHQSEFMSY